MLTMKDIVREGHPALREVAEEVALPLSESDKKTLSDMLQFVKNSQDPDLSEKYHLRPGVGVAAPQLGIKKRMLAVHFEDLKGTLYSDGYVNPKIVSHSVEQTYISTGEGCLSVDREVPGIVPRHKRITVKATTLDGAEVKIRLKGYAAVVFQHEIDHLNGIMFYDHINKETPLTPPENATPCDAEQ
ncbi:peptide deformylase [Halolactibacillus alkaliphilus]|uniref:Peptide deformylase n=1 Tax=Halolactibacillus alkaliphilus TaxID=442899 RepID=A0A511X3I8_9BACI|nr:peptide deformylase [Halolactibacillus alkaliphilus]GEN57510.1 peptide deformylase [Halolactibacillus alkaliphilus]GGN73715.1 peptide deformylase [Halolactibacillus alkaliphilus]SFO98148.1 peptide deformylase [Halolactibacillus alkaliphilus]